MKGKISVFTTLIAYCVLIVSSERECSKDQYGSLTPDANDCSKYYRCESRVNTQNFYWKNEECPPYEYYNWTVSNCIPNYDSCKDALSTPYFHCRTNEKQLDPNNVRQYFVCKSNTWTVQSCLSKHYYNETLEECTVEKRCEKGDNKFDIDDCSKYFVCNQNAEWVLMKCEPNMYFNNTQKTCVTDINDICYKKDTNPPTVGTSKIPKTPATTRPPYVPEKCIEKTTKPDLHNCNRYFTCENGVWLLKECLENQYFDIFFLECRTDDDGKCTSNKSDSSEIVKEIICKNGDIKTDDSNCLRYFKCINNDWAPVLCDINNYYNEKQKKCIEDNGICKDQKKKVTSMKIDGNTCNTGETKVDIFDCGRYYECHNDKWISKECDISSYYDIAKKECLINDGKCKREGDDNEIIKMTEKQVCMQGETKADLFDCARYYTCRNQKWVPGQCKRNMYYNNIEKKCILNDGSCQRDNDDNDKEISTTQKTIKNKKCKDGEVKADILDCKKYYLCIKETWTSSNCKSMMYFNTEKKQCIFGDGTCNNDMESETKKPSTDSCMKNGDMQLDNISCNRYYYCRDKTWELLSCPERYYFNETNKYCLPNIDNCKPTVEDSKTSECTEGKFKINRKDPTTYHECINTKWILQNCKDGLIFNMGLGKCEKKINTTTEKSIIEEKKCEDGVHKLNDDNKMTYYACTNGIWKLKSCPNGFIFDPNSTICLPDMSARNIVVKTK